jgi:hypothetical protein
MKICQFSHNLIVGTKLMDFIYFNDYLLYLYSLDINWRENNSLRLNWRFIRYLFLEKLTNKKYDWWTEIPM